MHLGIYLYKNIRFKVIDFAQKIDAIKSLIKSVIINIISFISIITTLYLHYYNKMIVMQR